MLYYYQQRSSLLCLFVLPSRYAFPQMSSCPSERTSRSAFLQPWNLQLSTLKPSSFNSFIFFRSCTLFVDGSHQLPYFQKLANSFPSHGGGWGKNERSFYPSRWRLPFRSSLATRHFSPRKSDELTHMDSHSCIKRASDEDAKPERAQLLPQKPWRSRESKDLSFSTCQCTKVTS